MSRFSHQRITDVPSARGAKYQRTGAGNLCNPSLLPIGCSWGLSKDDLAQPAEEYDGLVAEVAQQKGESGGSVKVIDADPEDGEVRQLEENEHAGGNGGLGAENPDIGSQVVG